MKALASAVFTLHTLHSPDGRSETEAIVSLITLEKVFAMRPDPEDLGGPGLIPTPQLRPETIEIAFSLDGLQKFRQSLDSAIAEVERIGGSPIIKPPTSGIIRPS